MATVGFGLESANVVGYSETGLRSGNKGVGACFAPVAGGTSVDLQDIKVVGYEEASEEEVSAMILDAYGRSNVAQTYYWIDVADGDDVLYGWYDSEGEFVEGVTLQMGEVFYYNAPSTDYSIQSAGQVPTTTDISVVLREGNKHVVNPRPVAIDINDEAAGVWISGYEEASEEEVSAMVLDEFGRSNVAQTYYWIDVADGDDVLYGWYDSEGELVEGVMLAPGEGLYFNAPSADYFVNFPKVNL